MGEDEPILEKATGIEIKWCPGKCLAQKFLKKKLFKKLKHRTTQGVFQKDPDGEEKTGGDAQIITNSHPYTHF